jgi:GDP-L-fucose synthase
MKRLITGGSGFIGKNLIGDIKLSSANIDLTNYDNTINCFRFHSPDVIIHCAAKHGNYLNMKNNPVDHFTENMAINMNVLRSAMELDIDKVIMFSSVTAFPHSVWACEESLLHLGEPHAESYGHGYAKRMIEVLVRAYREQYGLNYVCMFMSNVYGPHNDFNVETSTVVSNLIRKCHTAKIKNENLTVYGDGTPERDFMYVNDINDVVDRVIDNFDDDTGGSVIISNSHPVSIKQLVNIISDAMDFKGKIIWQPNANVGQSIKVSNNSKLMSMYPDLKFTDIEDGIRMTVEWFLSNVSKI